MLEGEKRSRNQPAPPHVIFQALTDPDRDPTRPWLFLRHDEQRPRVLEQQAPHLLVWSSLWPHRTDALVRFDLPYDSEGAGTDLCWTLLLEAPLPAPALLGHLRKRLNELINNDLRCSFG